MFIEHLRSAFQSLAGNKMRTALSMIGIIIGVASVVAITTLGRSVSESITSQIAQAGLETIIVSPGRSTVSNVQRVFQESLVDELLQIDGVLEAVAVNQSNFTIKSKTADTTEIVTSASPSFTNIFGIEVSEGRFITELDMTNKTSVVVLGSELAKTLFPLGDAVGSTIRLLGDIPHLVKVIGVLKEHSATYGFSFDSNAFMPRTSFLSRISKPKRVTQFVIKADKNKDVLSIASNIEEYLLSILKSETAYRVMSPSTIAETASGVTDSLSGFLAGIAAISLIVGGIGIMNIMLVSVTERTKEIGIRKAIGATALEIRMQFLIEAAVITMSGGIIGLALGWGGSAIAVKFLGWNFTFSLPEAIMALGFSAATGIFFGLYPAARASKLDPTVALSWE